MEPPHSSESRDAINLHRMGSHGFSPQNMSISIGKLQPKPMPLSFPTENNKRARIPARRTRHMGMSGRPSKFRTWFYRQPSIVAHRIKPTNMRWESMIRQQLHTGEWRWVTVVTAKDKEYEAEERATAPGANQSMSDRVNNRCAAPAVGRIQGVHEVRLGRR